VVGTQVYRQGALLDSRALADWLAARVLAGSALASRASLVPAPGRTPWPPPPAGGFVYGHRFAEPFGGLRAALLLEPLPELAGDRYVVALSAAGAGHRARAAGPPPHGRRRHALRRAAQQLRLGGDPRAQDPVDGDPPRRRDAALTAWCRQARRQECYGILTAESERLSRLLDNVLGWPAELGQRPMTPGDSWRRWSRRSCRCCGRTRRAGFRPARSRRGRLPPVGFSATPLPGALEPDNAIKYAREATEKGLITLQAAGKRGVDRARPRPGVPAHLRHVFEPFYRGQDELTRTASGAGIGLTLVRQLVERMGGRVTARNHPEAGFEVVVMLPG
jgi:hypothetical protein